MSQPVTLQQAAVFLCGAQDVFILTHKAPDGDTLGSGFALMHALRQLGKRAAVLCNDPIPARFAYLDPHPDDQSFLPQTVVTVDVADTTLLGEKLQSYADQIDLSIDHHGSTPDLPRNCCCVPTLPPTVSWCSISSRRWV